MDDGKTLEGDDCNFLLHFPPELRWEKHWISRQRWGANILLITWELNWVLNPDSICQKILEFDFQYLFLLLYLTGWIQDRHQRLNSFNTTTLINWNMKLKYLSTILSYIYNWDNLLSVLWFLQMNLSFYSIILYIDISYTSYHLSLS